MSKKSQKIISFISIVVFIFSFLSLGSYSVKVEARMRIHYNQPYEKWPDTLRGAQDDMTVEKGYIDVTRAPYRAKGDGVTDDTNAIQKAINDGHDNNLSVYFPSDKTFLVSKSIQIEQKNLKDLGYKMESARKFGNILIGGVDGKARPKIVLKDNVKDDKTNTVVNFYRLGDSEEENSGSHYISTFKGIDIDLGNNPKWNGISMDGAQFCSISNTKITGENFEAGAKNIPGNGTNFSNVEVIGGKYGVYQDAYRPSIIVTGLKCINQSVAGIYVENTRGGMTVAGFNIANTLATKGYVGIKLKESDKLPTDGTPTRGSIILKDGQIEAGSETGIYNYNQTMVAENVYVKASNCIVSGDKKGNPDKYTSSKDKWNLIENYAFTSSRDGAAYFSKTDGAAINKTPKEDYVAIKKISEVNLPPSDLINKHSYQYKDIPTWGINYVSINDFGATPDNDRDDDAKAIQKAIDAVTSKGSSNYGKAVFIPRGHYHIKSTISLKSGLKMFGAGKNISVIQVHHTWSPKDVTVAVDTQDVKEGSLSISEFAILGVRQDNSGEEVYKGYGNKAHENTILFRLRTNNTFMSDVMITRVEGGGNGSEFYKEPMILFTGNAGGKIYNSVVYDTSTSTNNGNLSGDYRIVLFDGVSNPLNVYGINGVHAFHRAEGANIEIKNSSNIELYSMKTESINTYLKIVDSTVIRVFGCAGTSHVDDSNIDSKVLIANSNDVKLMNFSHDGLNGLYGPSEKNKPWIKMYYGNEVYKVGDGELPILMFNFKSTTEPEKNLYDNKLKNPSFENGDKSWTSNKATLKVQDEHPYAGSYSAKVTNRSLEDDTIKQDITSLLKGQTNISFAGSARFKTEWKSEPKGANTAAMKIKVKMENGKYKEYVLGEKILEKEEKATQEPKDKYLNHWYNIYGSIDEKVSSPIVEAYLYFTFTDAKVNLYFDDIVLTDNVDAWILHGNDGNSTDKNNTKKKL